MQPIDGRPQMTCGRKLGPRTGETLRGEGNPACLTCRESFYGARHRFTLVPTRQPSHGLSWHGGHVSTDPAALLPLAGQLRQTFRSAEFTVDGVDDLLGPLATTALGRGDLVPALAEATGDSQLDVLVRLFLLGCSEPAAAADFLPAEVLEEAGPGLVRAALDIRPHEDDWWVAADIARVHPPAADHVIGIGSASMTLVASTVRRPVGAALDLGTGCGIQALHLTRHAARVTATDSVPRAIEMTRLTLALSGFAPDEVEVLLGDLYAPVSGRQFDLIVSNPPFVLAPADSDALTYRDTSSGDGDLGQLLYGAQVSLAPGGVAQMLTSWVVDGDWRETPAGLLPPGCDALVLLREVLDPAQHVALWRDDEEAEPAATVRALRWLAHLASLEAEGVAYGMIVLRRTESEPRVRFIDVRGESSSPSGERLGAWLDRGEQLRAKTFGDLRLRVAPGVRLVEESVPGDGQWDAVQGQLIATAALPQTIGIDQVTRSLLLGCDGSLPISAVAELLAVATGAPTEGVLRVAEVLLESGHLTA